MLIADIGGRMFL